MGKGMIKRNIIARFKSVMEFSPAVYVVGARQVGKSTLVKILAENRGYHYVSLDDPRAFTNASQDPMGFLEKYPKPLIIDEVQLVPELFLPIKLDIDNNRTPGRYILTG